MMRIRVATRQDSEYLRKVYLSAFSDNEKQMVATLAVNLLNEETDPKTISLVAEVDGEVVGHIAFSPLTSNNNKSWRGYILAPLGVKPKYQKRQIGSKLIKAGMEKMHAMSVNVVFVYGDPKYYGRFGFKADVASRYSPPYQLEYSFGWQAIILNEVFDTDSVVKVACVASLNDPELW